MSRDWTRLGWREQTWWERFQNAASVTAAFLIALAMAGGFLFLVGRADDANVSYHIEHDRCLKHATNGYDIQRCR